MLWSLYGAQFKSGWNIEPPWAPNQCANMFFTSVLVGTTLAPRRAKGPAGHVVFFSHSTEHIDFSHTVLSPWPPPKVPTYFSSPPPPFVALFSKLTFLLHFLLLSSLQSPLLTAPPQCASNVLNDLHVNYSHSHGTRDSALHPSRHLTEKSRLLWRLVCRRWVIYSARQKLRPVSSPQLTRAITQSLTSAHRYSPRYASKMGKIDRRHQWGIGFAPTPATALAIKPPWWSLAHFSTDEANIVSIQHVSYGGRLGIYPTSCFLPLSSRSL